MEQDTQMQSVGELLKTILSRSETGRRFFEESLRAAETLTPREFVQRQVDRYNRAPGNLNDDDLYDCPKCLNRGDIAVVDEWQGRPYQTVIPCPACAEVRRSIRRMRASGLENTVKQCTFDRFEAKTEWQKIMLNTARAYAERGAKERRWLFMGGAVGSGKTHLCTAVCRELLYAGTGVYYMPWQSESTKLKAIVNDDDEEYARILWRLKNIAVLYIDDFFKPVAAGGVSTLPTAADVKLAYDILNYRYINRLPTILSSERYLSELMDIDEATASRIYERANGYLLTLTRDRAKNHRIQGGTTL